MKKNIFSIIILYALLITSAYSQGSEVILVRFEHQTDTPVAYPDYFKDRRWVDSLLNHTQNWLKDRFSAQVFDYKQRSPITYLPSIQEDKGIRSIQSTVYDLALSVISVLESGLTLEKVEDNKGKLRFSIELADKNGRRVFRNYVSIPFNIVTRPEAGEVYMGQADFRRFYREALMVAFKQKPKKTPYIFFQPYEPSLEAFINQANKGVFTQKDRVTFQLYQEKDSQSQDWAFTFSAPYTTKSEYGRGAEFSNPFNQLTYTFKGQLEERNYPEVLIDINEGEDFIGRLKHVPSFEQTLLEGELGNDFWSLSRNLQSKLIKINRNEQIKAIFFFKEKGTYEVYLSPSLSKDELSQIANLWSAESIAQAVQKYYEVETGEGK